MKGLASSKLQAQPFLGVDSLGVRLPRNALLTAMDMHIQCATTNQRDPVVTHPLIPSDSDSQGNAMVGNISYRLS